MLKKKVVCPRSHPASRVYTHVYSVHIYEYAYAEI